MRGHRRRTHKALVSKSYEELEEFQMQKNVTHTWLRWSSSKLAVGEGIERREERNTTPTDSNDDPEKPG